MSTATGTRPAPTSTAPTGRAMWLRSRGLLAGALALVLVSVAYAAVRRPDSAGTLDPTSYSPGGAHALAALLADRGVPVQVVGDLPALRAAAVAGSTVLVPLPDLLSDDELEQLRGLAAPLVVLGADQPVLDALDLPVTERDVGVEVRRPACDLPAATAAGTARTGGASYLSEPGTRSVGCYATGGQPTVLALPDLRTTLVGAPDLLTNDRLGSDGNAALALGLLGGGDRVVWLLPDPRRAVPGGGRESVRDLLPDGVLLGALQLVVAVVLLALWRARRLGRVVPEPLPVVVRAAEAVEGRGRLYRAAGARGTAAEALRAGARDRLARRLGLPRQNTGDGAHPDRVALVGTLAARTGRHPAEVDGLLYGAAPADDATLVRLADALDGLSV